MTDMAEYLRVEAEFAARKDSLCEHVSPAKCNCAECPARKMCEWLIDNDPREQGRALSEEGARV